MAYQTGVASTKSDLISTFITFAIANGWTQDRNSGEDTVAGATIHKGSLYMSFRWRAADDDIAVYHSLGYDGAANVWDLTDDSGNGSASASSVIIERRFNGIGSGPYTAYYFFAHTNSLYGVVQYASGQFRHFGACNLDKVGDWTGGECVYASCITQTTSDINTENSLLCDGIYAALTPSNSKRGATVHMEGFPNQPAASKWGNIGGYASNQDVDPDFGDDRAGEDRMIVHGATRSNLFLTNFGWLRSSLLGGNIPLIPLPLWYLNNSFTPPRSSLLGTMPDVFHIQMHPFDPTDELPIGGDTYVIIPGWQKASANSKNMGLAYLK